MATNIKKEKRIPSAKTNEFRRLIVNEYMAVKKCKHGTFLFNLNDTFIGKSLDIYGEWGETELEILDQILHPGSIVLDVGANIGTHTVYFAKKVTDQGVVFAFEPQRLVYQNLCANISLNALRNVHAFRFGVGDIRTTIRLPLLDPKATLNFGAVPIEGHNSGELVDIVKIDDFNLPGCTLIKIDVEGMETKVLSGASKTIELYKPVLFVENNTTVHSSSIIRMLMSLGYDAYWHISGYYNPKNFFRNNKDIFSNFQPEANLLCFHHSFGVNVNGFLKVESEDDDWQKAVKRMAVKN